MPTSTTPSLFQGGIRFQDGALQMTAANPTVVNSGQFINTNIVQTVSYVAPLQQTFLEVPIYLNSRGDGSVGTSVSATLTWTGVSGVTHTVILTVDGDVAGQVQLETFPILVLGNSLITIVTSFSSTSFHYDIVSRLLFMNI